MDLRWTDGDLAGFLDRLRGDVMMSSNILAMICELFAVIYDDGDYDVCDDDDDGRSVCLLGERRTDSGSESYLCLRDSVCHQIPIQLSSRKIAKINKKLDSAIV